VVTLTGAGCVGSSKVAVQNNQQVATDCELSIDISGNPENKTEYTKASFTYPCAWESQSSATEMKLLVPNTNMGLTYPSSSQRDLPMNGVDMPIDIMGEEHMRYIVRDANDVMGDVTYELIRGPVVDELGTRPFYQYSTGSTVGDQIAGVFASLKLE